MVVVGNVITMVFCLLRWCYGGWPTPVVFYLLQWCRQLEPADRSFLLESQATPSSLSQWLRLQCWWLREGWDLHDGCSELKVSLVHLCALSHIDLQVVPATDHQFKLVLSSQDVFCLNLILIHQPLLEQPDQSKEGGGEGHPSLLVDRHVHPEASNGNTLMTMMVNLHLINLL